MFDNGSLACIFRRVENVSTCYDLVQQFVNVQLRMRLSTGLPSILGEDVETAEDLFFNLLKKPKNHSVAAEMTRLGLSMGSIPRNITLDFGTEYRFKRDEGVLERRRQRLERIENFESAFLSSPDDSDEESDGDDNFCPKRQKKISKRRAWR